MANKNPNIKNLKPIQKGQLSKAELKKRQSNGGKKSVVVKRQRKTFKETLKMMLELNAPAHLVQEFAEKTGLEAKTVQDLVTGGLVAKAVQGDVKAFEVARDTMGEKPAQEIKGGLDIVEILKRANEED